jgi:catechol 2,3-dioxygenase-like lactoylglutathione lyase family enzyme
MPTEGRSTVQVAFVAGFSPIVRDPATSQAFYRDALGLSFEGAVGDYVFTEQLAGARHFGLWPLREAAQACFGAPDWPAEIAVPQASVEFEVDEPAGVEAAAAALQARGCRLTELSLYEWQLPDDTGPLQDLVRDLIAGRVDAIAFTSQIQARHLFQVAADFGQADALTQALNGRTVVAAIGPTCATALQRLGVTPDVVPEHPKMGHLVVALARHLEPGTSTIPTDQ